MRKYLAIALFAAAALMLDVSLVGAADNDNPESTKTADKDPNFRFHNGQWWYWMSGSQSWKVWDGTRWTDYQPGQRRVFSYQEPASDSSSNPTFRMFGRPLTSVPDSVSTNNQIIGSFGFRGAASKALGKY